MKMILSLILIASGGAVGYLKSRMYQNRLLHLQELSAAFRRVETEMAYRKDPLVKIFRRIGMRRSDDAERFFFDAALRLENSNENLEQIWREALFSIYAGNGKSMTDEDLEFLQRFGAILGQTDVFHQKLHFTELQSELEFREEEAKQEIAIRGRVCRGLYLAVSAAGAILLF